MLKKLFLASIASAIVLPSIISPAVTEAAVVEPFKDISSNNPYYEIIHDMRDQGIISGYEDGNFRGNESISRKHAAALVSRAKSLPVKYPPVKFKDVSEKNAYFNDIQKLQQAGILHRIQKGIFIPTNRLHALKWRKY